MTSTDMHTTAATPTRLDFDGLDVYVDPSAAPLDHVEVTFSTRWAGQEARTTYGIALTPTEARKLAEALLDGVAPALGHAPLAELEEHVTVARKALAEAARSALAAVVTR